MKIKKGNFKSKIWIIVVAFVLLVVIAAVYISQLDKNVSNNIIQNISEIAEHDQKNIKNNVEATWTELENIRGKISSYQCDTISDIETLMNIECANSEFSHIYLVSEDGKVYTDKFVTYDPESSGQNGRIDILPYFENGHDRVVGRFDDKVQTAGLTKESILYGIRLENFTVEGISMMALVGISDISSIQDRLAITSFTKDGKGRGYSAVIDMNGNYIVDVERTVYLNKKDSFFEKIDGSVKSDLTSEEIAAKMEAGESFIFYHTNAEGTERIVYCMPFEDENISWYFLASVESTVFTEQNRTFLVMSMVMIASVLVVIVIVLILAMISQNKVITANAEAKARSTFLANMSHEIRTPLNGIIGLLFLLQKDLESELFDKEVISQRLAKAKDTADYLLSLINNILDVSKLQAGKVDLKKEILSPEIITDTVWSMQRSNIENRGINFIVEKDITVPWIIGDDLMIKQVLMNILGNAAKFTPSGGTVRFSVTQKKNDEHNVTTVFVCEDTGCGMSEEFLEHIWDSFSQERSSNSESVKGTGLGMAISRLLMDAMNGEIRVKSKLGEGSTFYVILHSQISEEPPEYLRQLQNTAERSAESNTEEKKAVRILVAEDNELNAEILIDILESEGFDVVHAENGKIAVDLFAASEVGTISVILMDMQMPVMDGCEATMQIRKMDRPDAKQVSIFACTANNFSEDRKRAEESGMDDFLSKPIDVNALLKKLGGGNARTW
jgi:signal transduction histidine kinase/ActR/RegA family two-component response regulator